MDNSLARLNLSEIFCDIDDLYQVLERLGQSAPATLQWGRKTIPFKAESV
jgi:hypothetical protein